MANINKMIVQFIADTTNVKAGLADLEGRLNSFQTKAQMNAAYAGSVLGAIGGGFQTAGSVLQSVGSAMTQYVTFPLLAVGAAAVKAGIDFETAFAGVRKTVDEDNNTHFPVLKENILAIARETGIAATKVAEVMQVAGQLGIRGDEALTLFTEKVSKLTLATNLSAESIAMMLGKFVAISGLDVADNIGRVADIITNLGNNSATTEGEIMKFAVRIAAVGRIAGLSAEEVFSLAAAAESSGTKAERGGTAMTKIFLAMQSEAFGVADATEEYTKQISENQKQLTYWTQELESAKEAQANLGANATSEQIQALSDRISTAQENIASFTESGALLSDEIANMGKESGAFAKILGITDSEFKALYKSTGGAMVIFQGLVDKIALAQEEGKDIKSIFEDLDLTESRLMQTVLSLAQANDDQAKSMSSLNKTLETSRNAQGALQEEVRKRLDTVSAQWARLKEILRSIAVIFTDDQNGVLKEYLKTINTFLDKFVTKLQAMSPEQIKKMVDNFIKLAALGPALTIFGNTLTGLGKTLEYFGGIGGRFKLAGMDPESIRKTVRSLFGAGPVDSELDRVGKTWAFKLGKGFNDKLGDSVFNPNNWKSKMDSFADDLNWNLFERGKTNKFVYDEPELEPQRYRNEKGQFAGTRMVPVGAPTSGAEGAGFTIMQTQMSALSVALSNIIATIPAVIVGIAQITLVATGLAVILGAIVGGLTLFFVSSGQTTEQVEAMFVNLNTTVQNFFAGLMTWVNNAITGFPAFAAKMAAMFPVVLAGVTQLINSAVTGFFEFAPKLIELGGIFLINMVTGLFDNLPELISAVIDIGANILTGLLNMLPSIIDFAFKLISALVYGIIKSIPALIGGFIEITFTILKVLSDFIMSGKLWDIGKEIIEGLVLGIAYGVIALIKGIGDLLMTMWNLFLEFFGIASPSKEMFKIGEFIIEGLLNGIKAYFQLLKTFWTTVPKFLLDTFIGVGTWLLNFGKDLLKGLWDGILWYYSSVFKVGFKVSKWVLDAFIGSGKWLLDVGKNIMTGLKDGIFAIGGNMGQWVIDLGGKFVNGVKNFFGIKSPSRVFMGIGNYIGEGLVMGLNQTNSDILKAADAMSQAAMIDPSTLSTDFNSDGTIKHDYSALTEAFITALDAVGVKVYLDGKQLADNNAKHTVMALRRG